jgi:hypothetical protein
VAAKSNRLGARSPVVLAFAAALLLLILGGAFVIYTEQNQLRYLGHSDRRAHGMPIAADPKSLVLAASDVGTGFQSNSSKSGYDHPPCDIDDVSGDGRISAYEATINPPAHDGWVQSIVYKYTTEAKAEASFQRLLVATASGLDAGICQSGLRYPSTLAEMPTPGDLPAGIHSFQAGGSSAFVWRNRNVIEKLNVALPEHVDALHLVRRQNSLAATSR